MAKSEKNYGLSLLKVIMCFEVLCCHFLSSATTPIWRLPLVLLKTSAVPVFMVISFLLCRKAVVSGATELLGRRVRRLLWPQISWAVAYYLLCFVLNLLDSGEILSPVTLVWQLLTGSNERLNPAMWFQTDLILLTVIFSLLFAWLKPRLSHGIILLVAAICLILQYGGMNYALFEPLQTEIKYSLGRIVEVWPFAAAAICLFSPKVLENLKKHWVWGCLGGLLLGAVSFLLKKPCGIFDSFGYAGIHMTLGAVGMVTFCCCLPLEKLGSRVTSFIEKLSRYTLGIYCSHLFIAKIFDFLQRKAGVTANDLAFTVAVFAGSYLMCHLLERTGKKQLIAMVR